MPQIKDQKIINIGAANLVSLRNKNKLTQTQLAKKANISLRQLQYYEHGVATLDMSALYLFAKILKVEPAKFFMCK